MSSFSPKIFPISFYMTRKLQMAKSKKMCIQKFKTVFSILYENCMTSIFSYDAIYENV